ncbi:MAG: alcohol dehydrogenase [Pseudomonadales bacterium]|nr:MAG: alcohol dehydrogenase [Pseudomonadales bacterium]
MIRCKAAVLRTSAGPKPYADSKPISIEDVTLAPPMGSEVVVKVTSAGLCQSDLSNISGKRAPLLPLAFGHEGAGEIVEVGSAVTDINVGDHIVFQFNASCGRCEFCLEGRPQLCSTAIAATRKGELMAGGRRFSDADGNALAHHTGVSCFAEYTVVDRGSVVVIDKSFPLKNAAIFGCAVMTGVGAVFNTAHLHPGDDVAIIGLGGVGLSALLGAKLAGAGKIIAVDLDPKKFARAKALGATHTVAAGDSDCVEQIRDLTGGGVHIAFEFAGAIPAMTTAYGITRRGGTVVAAGLPAKGAQFSFDPGDLVIDEKAILGSTMGSCIAVRDIPRFIQFNQDGRLPVDSLIDRFIGFDELNAGFDLLDSGAAVRQILLPHLK